MKILILNGLFLNTSLLVSEYLNSVYIQIEQLWPCSVASMDARLRSSVTTAPCLKECNAIQGPIQCHAMPFNVSIQCNTIQDPHSMQGHSRSPFNAIPFKIPIQCKAIQGPHSMQCNAIQCNTMPFKVPIQCNTIQGPHSMQYHSRSSFNARPFKIPIQCNTIQDPHSMQYHSRSPFNARPFKVPIQCNTIQCNTMPLKVL